VAMHRGRAKRQPTQLRSAVNSENASGKGNDASQITVTV